ncbi:MAG: tetratricopeptide repeat-containing sensor histidine kinase [Candidatus Delongbacteria bacterium]|nr:tetratricopeptide repeat-containing sensor histidine kinase [Candidatus Delongbacteria bacterium]MCG2760736.1 tetratricopeptide repeat-containing sensor histidine kinase [Candidatus Delongbacteria bacterium]
MFVRSKKINEELGDKNGITSVCRNISSLFISQGRYEEALVYIKRSHDIAKDMNLKDKLRDSYKLFSEIYGKKNNFKKALAYYVMYSKVNEEVLNLQKQQELHNISTKYENDKKDKENEIYKLKNFELGKMNKELKKSRTELMKSNSSKDKFFNIITHDLKNPFSILYTTSELLTTYYDELGTKKQKEYINTINVSAKHLLKLIENLLEWSRTQSGMRQFNPVEFNLTENLENCIDLLRPNADIKNISVNVSAEKDIVLRADKNMIKTVIRNFITNAIKFTKQGGEILVTAEIIDNSKLIFTVIDNGIGIKKKDLSKLFVIDKHFVTNGTANEKGTGIGLLLCKEFIEKHNGKVFVESKYRKGSVFGFEIPII